MVRAVSRRNKSEMMISLEFYLNGCEKDLLVFFWKIVLYYLNRIIEFVIIVQLKNCGSWGAEISRKRHKNLETVINWNKGLWSEMLRGAVIKRLLMVIKNSQNWRAGKINTWKTIRRFSLLL